MAGSDSRNENRAAVLRLMPANSAPLMVHPDRLAPGSRAHACHSPTQIASFHVRSASPSSGRWRSSFRVRCQISAASMSRANTMDTTPMEVGS